MSALPNNPSEAFKKRNPHLYGGLMMQNYVAAEAKKLDKRIRQDPKPLMNGLETEFHERLKGCDGYKAEWTFAQALRFRLGNGIWYKPDFVINAPGSNLVAYEVKGPHSFRGGFENLKIAASTYPAIMWFLVWKENNEWKQQTVLP